MHIKVDFKNQYVLIKDGKSEKKVHWFSGYYSNITDMLEQHSVLVASMRKYFLIDGFNYADLVMPIVYQHDYFFQNSPGTLIIYNYLEILDSIKFKKGSTVNFEIDDFYKDTFIECSKLVAKKKGFKINIVTNTIVPKKFTSIYNNNSIMKFVLKSRIALRYPLGMIRKILFRTNSKDADVVFLSNVRFARKTLDDNSMFSSTASELNNLNISNKILFYEEAIQSKNIGLLKKHLFEKQSYIGDYYSLKHFRNNNSDFKKLRDRYYSLKDDKEFQSNFKYNGYNYYELIISRLELVFNALSYLSCDMKNIAREINRKENYKVMVIDHAENTTGKAFMLHNNMDRNSRKNNRKVVALSHEQIYPGCLHTCLKDRTSMNRKSKLWRPVPDVSCQWGITSKKILIKYCAYPSNVIKITGSPKFDSIFNKKYDTGSFMNKYPFYTDSRKKILIVSSNMFEQFKIYLDIATKNPDYLFVYKPHPNEGMDLVRGALKDKPSNMIVVEPSADTYSLTNFSDYVLMFNTTAGFEAMLFNKIVLMVIYNDIEPDGIKFKGSGAVIEVSNGSDVKNALHKLQNPVYEHHMKQNVQRFVDELHYGNDGKAAKRTAEEIRKIV